MKKKIIIVIAIVFVAASLVGWFMLLRTPNTNTTPYIPTPSPLPQPTLPNAYPSLPLPSPITTTTKYSIDYVSIDQTYYISILATPYEQNQTLAEKDLLGRLNLTPIQACDQIKVNISMPYYVDKSAQPVYHTFSFCSQ